MSNNFVRIKQLSGNINANLTLTDRTSICERCVMIKDRYLNAAINLNKVGKAHPEPTDACGHDGSVSEPLGAEATIVFQKFSCTRLEGELRVRRTGFVRRREVRPITPCKYIYEEL